MRKLVTMLVACTLVLGVAACGGDDDDDDVAASSDTTEATTADDAAMPQEVCNAWAEWGKTGSDDDLAAFRTAIEGIDNTEILDAVTAMETPETDTADGQAAYEGAYDFINSELDVGGCPPSRWTDPRTSG